MENRKKKVLIALDFNPTAQKVAEVGYAMAKAMHAEVTLLHVIAEPVYYSGVEYSPIMGFSGYTDTSYPQLANDSIKNSSHIFLDKLW